MGIFLCTIVCSVANALGNAGSPQELSVSRNDIPSTMVTAQLAEKSESETDVKPHTPLFVIHTVAQVFHFDVRTPGRQGPLYATMFGGFLSAIPRYLVERKIRI
jgi:hypothetical protein